MPDPDVEKWVKKHGSSRLKKAMALGLLDKLMGVYRDERLAHERPGWAWLNQGTKQVVNPPESALDLYAAMREEWGEQVQLVFLPPSGLNMFGRHAVVDSFLGRTIVKVNA
jgi:hypothetical protein